RLRRQICAHGYATTVRGTHPVIGLDKRTIVIPTAEEAELQARPRGSERLLATQSGVKCLTRVLLCPDPGEIAGAVLVQTEADLRRLPRLEALLQPLAPLLRSE